MLARRRFAVFALCLGLSLSLGATEPEIAPEDDTMVTWQWVRTVVDSVEDDLGNTLDVAPETGFTRTLEWQVVVTANDGWSLTWKAVVQKTWSGTVRGRFFELLDNNLTRQLFELRQSDPTITAADATQRLAIEAGSTDSTACQPLSSLARELEDTVVPALPDNTLRLHAPSYRIEIATTHSPTRHFALYADEGALAEWCDHVLSTMRACGDAAP